VSELPQNIEQLISLLHEQTESGRRTWEEGSARTEFVHVRDSGSIVILSVDGNDAGPFELRILDPYGTPIETVDSTAGGSQILSDLYLAARKSAMKPSQVIESLIQELMRTPGSEVEALMASTVDQVAATQGKDEKAEVLKPVLRKRVEDLIEKGNTTLKWPQLIEPFPGGGGMHNALPVAFRALRQSGEVVCEVNPEPGPNQGFAGGKTIQLKSVN
jgi:hypothetical protein